MWAITYMANSIEQVLLLPRDMTKLRNLKKLNIPVSQEGLSTGKLSNPSSLSPSFSTRYIVHLMINLELTFSHIAEEWEDHTLAQDKEKESSRFAAINAQAQAEKKAKETLNRLTEYEKAKKSVEATMV